LSRTSPAKLAAHNLDAIVALLGLLLFAATSLPLEAWFWATLLWAVNRFLQARIERRATVMPALRAVGVMGASMLLRPWIGMLVLFLITRHEATLAISATLFFMLLITLDIVTRVLTHKNIRTRPKGAH
jgi:hypothetical protein